MPGEIGGDETAERRTDDGSDQRGYRDPGHRMDERTLVDGAQQHQTSDRGHHCAPGALHDTRNDKLGHRGGQRTANRADHENGNRETEYHSRAEPIGGPSARRYEHRERQQVGGNRELERQRAGADIGGDRGKRCRNHRRIHVFHEQGSGHDQRDQTFFFHGDSGARWLAAGARAVSSLGRAGYCGTLAST